MLDERDYVTMVTSDYASLTTLLVILAALLIIAALLWRAKQAWARNRVKRAIEGLSADLDVPCPACGMTGTDGLRTCPLCRGQKHVARRLAGLYMRGGMGPVRRAQRRGNRRRDT